MMSSAFFVGAESADAATLDAAVADTDSGGVGTAGSEEEESSSRKAVGRARFLAGIPSGRSESLSDSESSVMQSI